jgi:hypothetical protein
MIEPVVTRTCRECFDTAAEETPHTASPFVDGGDSAPVQHQNVEDRAFVLSVRHHFVSLIGVRRWASQALNACSDTWQFDATANVLSVCRLSKRPVPRRALKGRGTGLGVQVTETELPKGVKSTAVVLDKTIFHSQVPAETSVASHSTKQTYG